MYRSSTLRRRTAGTLAASAALALSAASPAFAADSTDPTVSITSLTSGQLVSGKRSFAASAKDSGGIARVEFRRGSKLLSSDSSSPYSHSWNTTFAPEGAQTISAKAFDRSGNSRTASVSVTVRNAPSVAFSAPTQGKTVAGTLSGADCTVSTQAPAGIARVEFSRDGIALNSDTTAPYSCSFDSRSVSDGAHTLSAKLIDSAGRSASASVAVNTDNTPSVAFTAPTAGKVLVGSLDQSSCTVQTKSFVGIKAVEFSVDGSPLNTDASAPYGCELDTTKLSDGAHTLRAKAIDLSGGSASAALAVSVDNPAPVEVPPVKPDPVVTTPVSGRILNDWSRLSMWDYVEEVSADRVREDSTIKRHATGGPSIRYEVRDGEHGNGGNSGERAETRDSKTGIQRDGDDVHFGFSSYLAPGFSVADPDWRLMVQWHAIENPSGSPPFDIQIKKGKFYLTLVKSSDGTYNGSRTYTDIEVGDATTGKWHDFVMHVKFSKSATTGRVKVWNNGVLKADRTHRTIYTNSAGNYIKAGVYRNNNYTNTDILYMSGLKGASTFEAADPGRP